MTMDFADFFKEKVSDGQKRTKRDAFLSRLFGVFSEEIVQKWAESAASPYEYLGRPTVWQDKKFSTLDFLLSPKQYNGERQYYLCEMKCELQYENYRYLCLNDIQQILHHGQPAFDLFRRAAKNPTAYPTTYYNQKGKRVTVTLNGAILIWGSVQADCVQTIKEHYGFYDILSVENMINDLNREQHTGYKEFVEQYRKWTAELFDALLHNFK